MLVGSVTVAIVLSRNCVFVCFTTVVKSMLLIKSEIKQILVDAIIYVQNIGARSIVKFLLEHVPHKFITESDWIKKLVMCIFATVYDVLVINIGGILM